MAKMPRQKPGRSRQDYSIHVVHRENGLIEIVCPHGIGHPSRKLTPPKFYYGVHGCDGCCSLAAWALAELEAQDENLPCQD